MLKNRIKQTLIGSIVVAFGGLTSWALAEDYAAVEEAVRTLVPGAKTIAVADSPVPGLVEVQINSDIVYMSDDGKYLVQGRMIDLASRADLTDVSRGRIRKEILRDLDAKEQIAFGPKEAKHQLLVFTDIDCGYCRKLHNQVAEYNKEDIAIRYLMFPRAGIGSPSYDKAVSVWCAADQRSAMTSAKAGEEPEAKQCTNPIKAQYELGMELGVTGTPALLTTDGTLIPGYVPPAQLKQRLDALAGSK